MGTGVMFQVLFLLGLIALNAFFAASEMAFITLNDNKIKMMADEGDPKAILLERVLSHPTKFLSTIQIGITMAGFLASAFASDSFSGPLVTLIYPYLQIFTEATVRSIVMVVITLVLSLISLIFGELVPKRVAMNYSEGIAFSVVKVIYWISILFHPFVKFLTFSTNIIVRLFGIDPNKEPNAVTEEEIRMMVDVGEEKGSIRDTEKEMINNIFEFDNINVSDIMTHRTDVSGIEVNASFDEVKKIVFEEQYTRFPVYEETIDDIIGILHVKDLLQFIEHQQIINFNLKALLREPYFVPESKKTDELFRELQKRKVHIAVVIDEYGGTAGIITIEDLIEEIVGNIFDEYDDEEKQILVLNHYTFDVDGAIDLEDLDEECELNLPQDVLEDYDTLSGFLTGLLGHIPEDNETVEIPYRDLRFKILKAEDKVIEKVRIIKKDKNLDKT
jgi:putative hemolysin